MNDELKRAIKKATIRRTKKMKSGKMKENFSLKGDMKWQEMPKGALVPNSGNSKEYKTGNWVPTHLVFNDETCIDCGLCWPVCPDDAIIFDEGGHMKGIDYDHCKDCGLCVEVCPTKEKSLYFEERENKDI